MHSSVEYCSPVIVIGLSYTLESPERKMTVAKTNLLHKWKLEMLPKGREVSGRAELGISPPGFSSGVAHQQEVSGSEDERRLLAKRSWEVALAPLKQVPMSLFMMYMAGNSISIFPIMMVGMMLVRPLKALISLQAAFVGFAQDGRLLGQKFVFIVGQLVGVALGLYKCQSMGLLPTHQSDWLAFVQPQTPLEYSAGGFLWS